MRKLDQARRERDVQLGLLGRKHKRNKSIPPPKSKSQERSRKEIRGKINLEYDAFKASYSEVKSKVCHRGRVTIFLPSLLNFSTEHDVTIANVMAIRELVGKASSNDFPLTLKSVNLDRLTHISTSAALVLTAELAKWEDNSTFNLKPRTANWNSDILRQLFELGFFKQFKNPPDRKIGAIRAGGGKRIVEYIRGELREHDKPRILGEQLETIIGAEIEEWGFLHQGITEAVINVTHHAYPDEEDREECDKIWFLTGSYDEESKALKIAFYDQGVTIPGSLPASEFGEQFKKWSEKLLGSGLSGLSDAAMMKAAMKYARTRTNELDRGKGLKDMQEYIKEIGNGYIAVISRKGIFRLDVRDGVESTSTHRLSNALKGTLIVWKVVLDGTSG